MSVTMDKLQKVNVSMMNASSETKASTFTS